MKLEASQKVQEGKLVKVRIDYDDQIENVNIRGDFFVEPAEAIYELEEKLERLDLDSNKEEIFEKLENVEAELIGFSRESIAEAFIDAAEDR